MDELLTEFLTETTESINTLDLELVALERDPNNPSLLSNIFRLFHTIKGTCGFLNLPRLEKVAHSAENVLGKFRSGEMLVTPPAVTLILESIDRIKALLFALEQTQTEPDGSDADLIARLDEMAEKGTGSYSPPPESTISFETAIAEFSAPVTAPSAVQVDVAPIKKIEESIGLHDGPAQEGAVAGQSIRVNVDVLENLMTMVSELVLTRNQLLQIMRVQKDTGFNAPLQRLNHVVSELQEGVMKTRMQPIGNAWSKLPRIVRDLSHELNKKIELVMVGADTELDRQVLELIKDPLTHMVRNSADHGIEMPADRIKAGKPETGVINLNAYHQGGYIIIEIIDNGRGLSMAKIKSKAIANGLVTEAEAQLMSDSQIQQMIFKPGFSTAETVTSVSGRGVGMDVVRTNIERIGGTIEMRSVEGKGSTFLIKIPLTLAIVSALILECGGERFAIPQISVLELVRASAKTEYKIERINGTPVFRLRNRLLSLIALDDMLNLPSNRRGDDCYIVVTQVGNYVFGLMVDQVFDTEEIVVKPVSPILRNINIFSGNTILGDGSVIMILDPNGIAGAAGQITLEDTELMNAAAAAAKGAKSKDEMALLLFNAGIGGPKAVPLPLVSRLEDIDLSQVEFTSGLPVIQYRGNLMPLMACDESFDFHVGGNRPLLVFADGERSMGLLVDEIVDIVEDDIKVQLAPDRAGLVGSAIISGRATEIIDVAHYLGRAFSDWFNPSPRAAYDEAEKRVLLVDDSPFFRNLMKPLLTAAGYHVTTVEGAAEALALIENGMQFDAVVSDIEMPGMSGFEFAQRLKQDDRFRDTPLVALSAFASDRDLDRGRRAGFTDYVAKFDRDGLLQTLSQTFSETKGVA
jgi:two-component system chemotaxis sensor kinase CheA